MTTNQEKMDSKFTKGKWVFHQSGNWCEIQIEEPIKSICAININVDEHIANAKLIATAPEMFDMLKLILNERVSNHYFKIKELITKITE